MTARGFIVMVLGALALIAAGFAGYAYFIKKDKADDAAAADPASFAGEEVEDALAVETPAADIPGEEEAVDALGDDSGVEGDPWLDPETVEGAEGSGDFVEDEPFEDVFDPAAGGYAGGKPVPDPIDPSELPPPDEEAPAAEPAAGEPEKKPAEPQ